MTDAYQTSGTSPTSPFEPLLDDKQTGEMLGLHPKTIQRLARRGEIPAVRIGRYWRYRASVLNQWIEVNSSGQPYWPTAGMEDHVRPAAKRAGITKRIGWHTLRHTFGTLINSQGADVATTKELMRHANVSITMDRYVQAVGEQKRQAQHSVVGLLAPNG